jgi:diacylglycerol kinase (ATP)
MGVRRAPCPAQASRWPVSTIGPAQLAGVHYLWRMESLPVATKRFSIPARLRSFVYAGRGLRTMLETQHNAWLHGISTMMVFVFGFWLRVDHHEWLALILAIVSVWTAESLNTAFEFLCDVASPDFHPLVAKAKDVAAGAVLIAAFGAATIAALVFLPRLWLLLS